MCDDDDTYGSSFDDSFSTMDDCHYEDMFAANEPDILESGSMASECIQNELFETDVCSLSEINEPTINCANGLPMVGCVDIEGNPYGCDSSDLKESIFSDDDE